MSYILEALKKSERERKIGAVPTIDTPQELPRQTGAAPVRSRLLPILALNALLVAGLLAYLLLGSPTRDQSPPEPGPQAAEPVIVSANPPARPPMPVAPAPQPVAVAPSVVADAGPDPAAPPVESQPSGPGLELTAKPLSPASDEPAPKAPAGPLPRWTEMPDSQREQISPPHLDVHAYSERPARRFVMIGARQYREGDRLPGGLRLEEITAEGVILSWQGGRFRLDR